MVLENSHRSYLISLAQDTYNPCVIKDYHDFENYFESALEPSLKFDLEKQGFNLKSIVEHMFNYFYYKLKKESLMYKSIDEKFGYVFKAINNLDKIPDMFGEIDFKGCILQFQNRIQVRVGEFKTYLTSANKRKAKEQCKKFLEISEAILKCFDRKVEIELRAEIHYSMKKGVSVLKEVEHGITYLYLTRNC
jgi:hypothetical protein